MDRTVLLIFTFLLFSFFQKNEIIITETGYGNIRIGYTNMSTIKRKHITSKKHRTSRHALLRTDDGGRVGRTFYTQHIKIKNGITYLFYYSSDTKGPVTLDEIIFDEPANVITDKGIKLGESTFADVTAKYGDKLIDFEHGKAIKSFDKIEFLSNRKLGVDTLNQNFIVTQIRIKK